MRRAIMTILVVAVMMAALQVCCQVPALAYGDKITLYGYAYQGEPWPVAEVGAKYVCVSGNAGNWKVNCSLAGKWQVSVPSGCSYWITAYGLGWLEMGPWKSASTQVSIPAYKWYEPWTWDYKAPNLVVPK